jgi:hypothetical protein
MRVITPPEPPAVYQWDDDHLQQVASYGHRIEWRNERARKRVVCAVVGDRLWWQFQIGTNDGRTLEGAADTADGARQNLADMMARERATLHAPAKVLRPWQSACS